MFGVAYVIKAHSTHIKTRERQGQQQKIGGHMTTCQQTAHQNICPYGWKIADPAKVQIGLDCSHELVGEHVSQKKIIDIGGLDCITVKEVHGTA